MKSRQTANPQLSLAFFLNLFFAIIEFVGGILTNSTAIIADAFHDFMDAVAIGIAVYMDKFSKKPPTDQYTYGYRRFALLSGICMSVILLIGAIVMIFNGITSFSVIKEVHSSGMFVLALLGIAVNGFAFIKIKNGNVSHHHTHNHTHALHDANTKAIMLHLLEDVLGWVAVLTGAVVMYFTQWFWIDGLLTIVIALFIGYNAIKNLWQTFTVLLQAIPFSVNIQKLKNELSDQFPFILITELHIWSVDGNENVATIKVQANHTKLNEMNTLQQNIKKIFHSHHIDNVTLEIQFIP